MRVATVLLAAIVVPGTGCGSTARGDSGASEQPLTAVAQASSSVEDVHVTTRVVHSLVGAKLKLRTNIRQTPDGSSLHARALAKESFGRIRQRDRFQMIVADGKIFARGNGRWRRVQETSPLFSYDEALVLLRRATNVERIGPDHYRAAVTVARNQAAPEPLNLLEEARRREATLNVFTDAESRLRRLSISAGPGGPDGRVEARLRVLAFDEGLQIEAPKP